MTHLSLPMTIVVGVVGALMCFAVYLLTFQVACTVLNKARRRTSPSRSVPEPPLGRACAVAAISLIGDVLIAVAVAMIVSMAGPNDAMASRVIQTVCIIPLSLLVGAIVFSEMLPTRYPNALLLRLIQLFTLAIVVGTIGLIAAFFLE
ncbi:MAG: hypothetical protein IIA67_07550 [Planctomycetes bacterium]|nr:hypothetical protein [Planctomycetota bacterium]